MAQPLSRDEFLQPYLNRLPSMLAPLKEDEVPIGGRRLSLNAWEHALLARVLTGGTGAAWWDKLVVEGVAFTIKLLQDLASSPVSPDDHTRLPEDSPLWADSAEGARLLDDLKAALNERIAAGDKNNYKHLNEFRTKLFNLLSEVRHLEDPGEVVAIAPVPGPVDRREIVEPAPITREARRQAMDSAVEEVRRMASERGRESGMTARGAKPAAPDRRRILPFALWGLAVLAGVAALYLLWPAGSAEGDRTLTLGTFKDLRVVIAVEAAPPKAILTVAREEWEQMYPPLRRSVLKEIAKRLEGAGYREAVIQTPDGAGRADWTAEGGIALR